MIEIDEKDLHYWLEHVKIYANKERSQIIFQLLANQAPEINARPFIRLEIKK